MDLAPGGDVGRGAARFLASSQSEFDPTGDERPGALDRHGSGEIDPRATVFTHLARLREAMPRWTLELFDVDGDLVADHLQLTAPATGRRWCVDLPEEPAGTYRHTAGPCPVPPDLAPVVTPGPGRRDGPG